MRVWLVSIVVCLIATSGATSAAASHSNGPEPTRVSATIDVPNGFGGLTSASDVDRARPGIQIRVRASQEGTTLRLVDRATGILVASESLGALQLRDGLVAAGFRLFLWGGSSTGAVRLWTPRFDDGRSFVHADPSLPCLSVRDRVTPVTGTFSVDVPTGYAPRGRTFVDDNSARPGVQLRAAVFGNVGGTGRRDRDEEKSIRIDATAASEAGGRVVTLGLVDESERSRVKGGFGFAGAIFAYGTDEGEPVLWSPRLEGTGEGMSDVPFVDCRPGASAFDAVSVDVRPQPGRAVTATIGPAGGAVQADAADGTHFRLAIPTGALATPTAITVAPADLRGLETLATGVVGAVDLQPAGLVFAHPAYLTVTPPSGTVLDVRRNGAVRWSSASDGSEVPLWTIAPGGRSATIEVPHFSGAALIQASADNYQNVVKAILQQNVVTAPGLTALLAANNLQGAARLLAQVYDTQVAPTFARADQSLTDLAAATRRFTSWLQLTTGVEDIPINPPNPETLGPRVVAGFTTLTAKSETLLGLYSSGPNTTHSSCTGAVGGVADWAVVPEVVAGIVGLLNGNTQRETCLELQIDAVRFPTALTQADELVDMGFKVVVSAPVQTPGGALTAGGRKGFGEAAHVTGRLHGGTFAGSGSDTLNQDLTADQILAVQIDRGPDPQARAPHLAFDGQVTGIDLAAEANLANPIPVHLEADVPTSVTVRWRPDTPVDHVLADDGGTNHVCVDVFDSRRNVLPALPVTFSLDGPGAISSGTSPTNSLGIACVNYTRPNGVVPKGLTAILTASTSLGLSEGRDVAVLTPEWVDMQLSVLTDAGSAAGPFAHGTVQVAAGVGAGITVTASQAIPGALVTDPGIVCLFCTTELRIESGGGLLTSGTQTGTGVVFDTDARGTGFAHWDPAGSTLDTTVSATIDGVAATVTFLHGARYRGTITFHDRNTVDVDPSFSFDRQATIDVTLQVLPDGTVPAATVSGHASWEVRVLQLEVGDAVCTPPILQDSTFSGDASGATFTGLATNGQPMGSLHIDFLGTESDMEVSTPDDNTCVATVTTNPAATFGLDFAPPTPVFDQSGKLIALDFTRSVHLVDSGNHFDQDVTGRLSLVP